MNVTPQVGQILKSIVRWLPAIMIIMSFHLPRIMQPTLLGDDVIRLVDARTLPLIKQLFRPFSEHIAPGFELLTAILVRSLGDSLTAMPSAFTLFAFGSWIVFLISVALWVGRITGRVDVARMTFLMVGVSSACIEVPWWFSASTYSLSAASVFGVLLAVEGRGPVTVSRLVGIAFLTGLAMSFSALGLMALVLGGFMIVVQSGSSKASFQKCVFMVIGLACYWTICRTFGGDLIATAANNNRNMTDIPLGLTYAAAVPGGVALPLLIGLDSQWITDQFTFLIAIPITVFMLLGVWLSLRKSTLKWHIISLLMLPYLVLYPTRAGLVSTERWNEPDFIYFWTSRYHLFAIVGLSLYLAIVISHILHRIAKPFIRELAMTLMMIAMLLMQSGNREHLSWMMQQPDQGPTLLSLMKLQSIARHNQVNQDELLQIFPPVRRGWNASVLELRPDVFPLVRLIADRSPASKLQTPQETAGLNRLLLIKFMRDQLGDEHWLNLRAERLLNLSSSEPSVNSVPVLIHEMKSEKAEQIDQTSWMINDWGGYIEFKPELENPRQALYLQNLTADTQIRIEWSFDGKDWDNRLSAWLETVPGDHLPVPEWVSFTADDLDIPENVNWPQKIHMRIKPVKPGKLSLGRLVVADEIQK